MPKTGNSIGIEDVYRKAKGEIIFQTTTKRK